MQSKIYDLDLDIPSKDLEEAKSHQIPGFRH